MAAHLVLNRVRDVALENGLVRTVRNVSDAVRARWRAFSFTRTFYHQARSGEGLVASVPMTDLSERLIARAVSPRLHALVQLRVASRIGSIPYTDLRMRSCRDQGWSSEQVSAALLANTNGCFSEAERLLLRYADDMTRTPIDVDRQVVREMRSYFSRAELLELTAAIAYENFRMRYDDAAAKLD